MSFEEIVGFDEIIGSFPPHSAQGYRRRRRHHSAGAELIAGLAPLIAGDPEFNFMAGADPADALMAIAGLDDGGDDDMMGVSGAELIAGLIAPKVKANAVRQAMARSFSPRTIDVQSRSARSPRRLALNFRSLAVPVGTTTDLSTRPQLPFRPERLFVQSDIAGNFEIVDIIIGNRSQFAQATPMSARIAAETSFGFDLHMDTAMVAMDVVLRIANITGAPSDFRATIAGTSAIP